MPLTIQVLSSPYAPDHNHDRCCHLHNFMPLTIIMTGVDISICPLPYRCCHLCMLLAIQVVSSPYAPDQTGVVISICPLPYRWCRLCMPLTIQVLSSLYAPYHTGVVISVCHTLARRQCRRSKVLTDHATQHLP